LSVPTEEEVGALALGEEVGEMVEGGEWGDPHATSVIVMATVEEWVLDCCGCCCCCCCCCWVLDLEEKVEGGESKASRRLVVRGLFLALVLVGPLVTTPRDREVWKYCEIRTERTSSKPLDPTLTNLNVSFPANIAYSPSGDADMEEYPLWPDDWRGRGRAATTGSVEGVEEVE